MILEACEHHHTKSYLLSYHERYKIVNNEDRKERLNGKYCAFHFNKYSKEVMAYYGPHFIERKAPGVILRQNYQIQP